MSLVTSRPACNLQQVTSYSAFLALFFSWILPRISCFFPSLFFPSLSFCSCCSTPLLYWFYSLWIIFASFFHIDGNLREGAFSFSLKIWHSFQELKKGGWFIKICLYWLPLFCCCFVDPVTLTHAHLLSFAEHKGSEANHRNCRCFNKTMN